LGKSVDFCKKLKGVIDSYGDLKDRIKGNFYEQTMGKSYRFAENTTISEMCVERQFEMHPRYA
jgi:hypothetical protein